MTEPLDERTSPNARAALDELGMLLLEHESTMSVLQRVVDLTRRAMPAVIEASITLLREERPTTAAFTGQRALDLDEMQYERGYGPCIDAALGAIEVEIVDGRTEDRWPDYMPRFLERGALSALAVPVPAAHLAAGLNLYAPSRGAFSEDDRKIARDFAAHAAVVLTNIDVLQNARDAAGHLRAAMEFRSVIEQAKGILMERHKLTPDQAFRVLAEASMHTNRKLRDVAEDLVLTGDLGSS